MLGSKFLTGINGTRYLPRGALSILAFSSSRPVDGWLLPSVVRFAGAAGLFGRGQLAFDLSPPGVPFTCSMSASSARRTRCCSSCFVITVVEEKS
jgi:hypothetical protein